ncbi:signal peptidase I [Chlamydiota bacterium]
MKKNATKNISIIISVLAVISIFVYLYTMYKTVSARYLIQSSIFSAVAVFFIRSYFQDSLEWNKSILIAFIIALIARTFIVQAFKIPTGSMEPTLHGDVLFGDRVLVNKFAYHIGKPKRGDVVVFRTVNIAGLDGQKDYIKRAAALPGEKVEIRNKKLMINDEVVKSPNIFNEIEYSNTQRYLRGVFNEGQYGMAEDYIMIPENNYFVLGDNSRVSRDSRFWGFVPQENFMGKAFMIYWPLNRFRLLKEK